MFKHIAQYAMVCVCVVAGAEVALAGNFDFKAAPEITLNRVYRLDKATGQISSCQYGLKEGAIGETICYPSGDGATSQGPGDYRLIASRHEKEGGVFRVDGRSGKMSICFVLNEKVVCTPPR